MVDSAQARKDIGDIIKARDGGVAGVAEVCGVHYTRIYAFLAGSRLEEPNAGKLRAALPEVPDTLWADAYAPMPVPRASIEANP